MRRNSSAVKLVLDIRDVRERWRDGSFPVVGGPVEDIPNDSWRAQTGCAQTTAKRCAYRSGPGSDCGPGCRCEVLEAVDDVPSNDGGEYAVLVVPDRQVGA